MLRSFLVGKAKGHTAHRETCPASHPHNYSVLVPDTPTPLYEVLRTSYYYCVYPPCVFFPAVHRSGLGSASSGFLLLSAVHYTCTSFLRVLVYSVYFTSIVLLYILRIYEFCVCVQRQYLRVTRFPFLRISYSSSVVVLPARLIYHIIRFLEVDVQQQQFLKIVRTDEATKGHRRSLCYPYCTGMPASPG